MSEQEGIEYSSMESSKKEGLRPEGPGARLRLTRQAKNVDLNEMSKQLRLTPQRIEQLEMDDYSAMGSAAFAKGYLRSYARLLGMGEEDILELLTLFDALNLQAKISSNKPKLIHERIVHTNPKATRRFGFLIGIVLLIMIGFWWNKHSSTEKPVVNKAPSAAASTVIGDPNTTPNNAEIQTVPLTTTEIPVATPENNSLQTVPLEPQVSTEGASAVTEDAQPKKSKERNRGA